MKKQSIILTGLLFASFFTSAQEFGFDMTIIGTPPPAPAPTPVPTPIIAAIDDSDMSFRTQTIGGWGNRPKMRQGVVVGKNPGSFLHQNFDKLFSDGITIGDESGLYLYFSEAQSVTDFLPSGGTPRALKETLENPFSKELKNTLASQVLALTISVKLGSGAAMGYADLGRAILPSENDMTVRQALELGNKVLAGASGEAVKGHTPSSINNIVSRINESFVDGRDQGTGYVERKF